MSDQSVRPAVQELSALGRLPSEIGANPQEVRKFEMLLRAISRPLTDDEASLLCRCFGLDGSFGLAATLMHLIETAPGWPLNSCLMDIGNQWIREMRERAERGGHRIT